MKLKLFEEFNKNYYYVGRVTDDLSPQNNEDLNGLDKYLKRNPSAFNFKKIDKKFSDKITSIVEGIFNRAFSSYNITTRTYTSNIIHSTCVHFGLSDNEYDVIEYSIKTLEKSMDFRVVRGSDDFVFITFMFCKLGPSKMGGGRYWRSDYDFDQWESYICDMAYTDGLSDVLIDVKSKFDI